MLSNWKMKLAPLTLALTTATLLTSAAFAGEGSGTSGGGGAVVCRDSSGKITSAEMLDLFEGRVRFGHPAPTSFEWSTHVSLNLDVARSQFEQSLRRAGLSANSAERVASRVRLIQNRVQLLPDGIAIQTSTDLGSRYAVLIKSGCQLEMVGYYEYDGTLRVVQDVFNSLDETNRWAFFLHEAVYALLREQSGAKDSSRARRIVSTLITDSRWKKGEGAIMTAFETLLEKLPAVPRKEERTSLPFPVGSKIEIVGTGPASSSFAITGVLTQTYSTGNASFTKPGSVIGGQARVEFEYELKHRYPDFKYGLTLFDTSDQQVPVQFTVLVDGVPVRTGILNDPLDTYQIDFE